MGISMYVFNRLQGPAHTRARSNEKERDLWQGRLKKKKKNRKKRKEKKTETDVQKN